MGKKQFLYSKLCLKASRNVWLAVIIPFILCHLFCHVSFDPFWDQFPAHSLLKHVRMWIELELFELDKIKGSQGLGKAKYLILAKKWGACNRYLKGLNNIWLKNLSVLHCLKLLSNWFELIMSLSVTSPISLSVSTPIRSCRQIRELNPRKYKGGGGCHPPHKVFPRIFQRRFII